MTLYFDKVCHAACHCDVRLYL